jgi:GNAT superfamily N-acetyltransferase
LFRDDTDFKTMSSISQRSWDADGVEWVNSRDELAHAFACVKDHDPRGDFLFAEVDGQAVGYGSISWDDSPEDPKSYKHSVHLLPEWRGRGIREAMFLWNEHMIADISSRRRHAAEKRIVVWVNDSSNDWKQLVDSSGYTTLWRLLEMAMTDIEHVVPTPLPDGIEVRPVMPGDYQRVWALLRSCFEHMEWSSPGLWTDARCAEWVASPNFMPSLMEVAWSGAEPVGVVESIMSEEVISSIGRRVAHTSRVCVAEQWRRKGIAQALLTGSLVRLRAKGAEEVTLDTEQANRSDAWRVYEKVGFRFRRTFVFYGKPL